ncbi:MAG: hypothetical protein JWP57_386 [Spirosoma sp.]|nr:hypothetical protein [Spirosoma sp.]
MQIAMEPLTSPIDEIPVKYPNLTRACQWIADLTSSEAHLVVWTAKNHISGPAGSKRVALFGDSQHLITQAVRVRNL